MSIDDLQATLSGGAGWPPKLPASGPLGGARVLDLSRVLAGPYCWMVLADLGVVVTRDRRSVALDLTGQAGRAVVRRLATTADVVVVVERFLPRHLAALGLDELRDRSGAVWVSARGLSAAQVEEVVGADRR